MIKIDKEIVIDIREAMKNGNDQYVIDCFNKEPNLIGSENAFGTWIVSAISFQRIELVKYFLEKGVDINYGGEGENSPLIVAVTRGNKDIVKLLLEKGADIDISECNKNPLYQAIDRNNVEMVKFFLEQNIDLKYQYKLQYDTVDALKYAKMWGTSEIVGLIAKKMVEQDPGTKFSDLVGEVDNRALQGWIDFTLRRSTAEIADKYFEIPIKSVIMGFEYHEDVSRIKPVIYVQTVEKYKMLETKVVGNMDLEQVKYCPEYYEKLVDDEEGISKLRNYLSLFYRDARKFEEPDQKVMEELLLKALMTLRKDGNLSDIDDVQYPVYPYIHDNSTAKELTAFAKKLNKKIDIKEYLAYVKKVK